MDFPGGLVVESLPVNAGDTGSTSPLGRPHRPRDNWACAPQEKPQQWEACSLQLESNPHSLQLEKARMQEQRPHTAKNKQINLLEKGLRSLKKIKSVWWSDFKKKK